MIMPDFELANQLIMKKVPGPLIHQLVSLFFRIAHAGRHTPQSLAAEALSQSKERFPRSCITRAIEDNPNLAEQYALYVLTSRAFFVPD